VLAVRGYVTNFGQSLDVRHHSVPSLNSTGRLQIVPRLDTSVAIERGAMTLSDYEKFQQQIDQLDELILDRNFDEYSSCNGGCRVVGSTPSGPVNALRPARDIIRTGLLSVLLIVWILYDIRRSDQVKPTVTRTRHGSSDIPWIRHLFT
jgi:hypothetical protein